MRPVVTAGALRAAELAAAPRLTEAALIGRASWAVARRALERVGGGYGRTALVVAGPGHNGADAVWAGAHLARRGMGVTAVLHRAERADDHLRDAVAALRAAGGAVGDQPADGMPGSAYDVGVDGLVGTGYARRPDGDERDLARLAGHLRAACDVVIAVDLPSGVVADTGEAAPWAVRADVTVTFAALKAGIVVGAGAELAGVVDLVDIGLGGLAADAHVLEADDLADLLPRPDALSSKFRRGVVGLVAGSGTYPGAAVLAAGGALRAGAGMVRLFAPTPVLDAVRSRWPEVVGVGRVDAIAEEQRVTAWVLGPGLGLDDPAEAVVRSVLARGEPVVVDADAITVVSRARIGVRAGVVLTPHAGEFTRLTGATPAAVSADPLGQARASAASLGATVLLKGMRTVVADPDGSALVNPTGTPWLATAGTGDVLAGAIGTLLASGLDPLTAAACAAWLHGLAARLAADDAPLVASDVAERWPDAVRRVVGAG